MKTETLRKIEEHGRQLPAIFSNATEQDPLELCRRLRRIEAKGAALALQLCNGPELAEGEQEKRVESILESVDHILGFRALGVPVFVNLDPRGYALKIDDEWLRTIPLEEMRQRFSRLHRDWGGYGIIAPEIK